jgi:hypothetical protein
VLCSCDEDSNSTVTAEHKISTKQFDDIKRVNICGFEPSSVGTTDSGCIVVVLTAEGTGRKFMALHCVHFRRSLRGKP